MSSDLSSEDPIRNINPIANVAVSILFILSLSGLASQKKAKAGNVFGIIGMAIALSSTFLDREHFSGIGTVWCCMIPAAIIGIVVASKVAMTAMPQLVAGFHSFVGLAAVLVGIAKFLKEKTDTSDVGTVSDIETFLGIWIGALTFTGSCVAFGKLQGLVRAKPLIICGNGRHVLNLGNCIICFVMMIVYIVMDGKNPDHYYIRLGLLMANTVLSLFLGWHLIMAIGGADMPVVISMLNSYSGWATAASGFMLNNDAMIVTGSLVGSSGAILSYIMCEAMNRAFMNVILGGFGGGDDAKKPAPKPSGDATPAAPQEKKEVHPIDCKGVVDTLLAANKIVFVPGYGLAVARGQHAIAAITEILRGLGKTVLFDIHPVAGRLPGHMNVLLAEANVPYDIVLGMDELADQMEEMDLAIVVGANDTVNPIALTDPHCAIAGMPIIETFKAKTVIINKRSMASGYAGVENPLFFYDNSRMYFGDARKAFEDVLGELNKRKSEIKVEATTAGATAAKKAQVDELKPEDLPAPFCMLGVPKEAQEEERMVALSPHACMILRKKGFGIIMEAGAGALSAMPDSAYEKVCVQIVSDVNEVYKNANVILKVQPPVQEHPELKVSEADLLRAGQTLISFIYPSRNPQLVDKLNENKVNVIAMDLVPRITRAQKLDALSSLSNLAGYRAVIEAAHAYGRVFTGQITAAGKLPPTTVFVIGAGVAGLAAIGTAKNLGAIVKAFDTRASVADQIKSMGGEFLAVDIKEDAEDASGYAKQISQAFIDAEMDLFARTCPTVDIIITTAAIPGKKAPVLITEEMVRSMKPGSVIVDLAAATGGNCEVTKKGESYVFNNVTIIGNTDLIPRMAPQGSQLYSQNLINLLDMLVDKKEKKFRIDVQGEEVIRTMTVCLNGEKLEPHRMATSSAPQGKKDTAPVTAPKEKKEEGYSTRDFALLIGLMAFLAFMIWTVPSTFINQFMKFVLAVIVGFHVVWSVTPSLHTPLMSVTNAISGIIAVGGMLSLREVNDPGGPNGEAYVVIASICGAIATFLACINIFGGFFITYRMLAMFHE